MAHNRRNGIISKILLSLVCGAAVVAVVVQEDGWVKRRSQRFVQEQFERTCNATLEGTIKRVTLFPLAVEMHNVVVQPKDGAAGWRWQAKKIVTQCSWITLLSSWFFDLAITLEDMEAFSHVENGHFAIQDHLNQLLYGSSPVPMALQSIVCKRGSLQFHDTATALAGRFLWNSDTKRLGTTFRGTVQLLTGILTHHEVPHFHAVEGQCRIDMPIDSKDNGVGKIELAGKFELPQIPGAPLCSFEGVWDGTHGQCIVKNDDGSLHVPVDITHHEESYVLAVQAQIPVSYLRGNVRAQGTVMIAPSSIFSTGSLALYDHQPGPAVTGSWVWNGQQGHVALEVSRKVLVPYLSYWSVVPHESTMTCSFDRSGKITGSYKAVVAHERLVDSHHSIGSWSYDGKRCVLTGGINDRVYEGEITHGPTGFGCKGLFRDRAASEVLFELFTEPHVPNELVIRCSVAWLRELALLYGYGLHGEGVVQGRLRIAEVSSLHIELLNGSLRLPALYNVMNGLSADIFFDHRQKLVVVDSLKAHLYKGLLACKHAVVRCDEQYRPQSVFIPFIFDQCLLNMQKDIFAVVSGALNFTYQSTSDPSLSGSLIIEHAHFKENIFSDAFQQRIIKASGNALSFDMPTTRCSLTVETKTPIVIKTALLDTTAHVNVAVDETLARPHITGTLSLGSGELLFPYKSLCMSKGSVRFIGDDDPRLELVAKNSIKNFDITLRIAGSLASPSIVLESWPVLRQEQIVALLLGGSPEISLVGAMPSLVMQNLTNLIMGDRQTASNIQYAFGTLLKPFKNIHFVPRFTDQTARGGLRGAVEISVNDRWRALIQKNFSLPEDTRLEVEYQLADDVTVKGVRDERRDLGGEVEMRWKF